VNWELEFYNERRRILARYSVAAPTPSGALVLARGALLAEYQPTVFRRSRTLFEQAQRVGGQDAEGWVLYRISEA
jgi:hypothetical protein